MDGSVAEERSRRGRRPALLERIESLLELRRESVVGEAMSSSESIAEAGYGLCWNMVGM